MRTPKATHRTAPFQTVAFSTCASAMAICAKSGDLQGVADAAAKMQEMIQANKAHWLRIAVESKSV